MYITMSKRHYKLHIPRIVLSSIFYVFSALMLSHAAQSTKLYFPHLGLTSRMSSLISQVVHLVKKKSLKKTILFLNFVVFCLCITTTGKTIISLSILFVLTHTLRYSILTYYTNFSLIESDFFPS